MTAPDRPTDHLRPLDRPEDRPGDRSIRELADELGISYEAARSRLRRKRSGNRPRPTDRPTATATDRIDASILVAQLRGEVSTLRATLGGRERELAQVATERDDLRDALARAQQGEAELRQLLAMERARALPAPVDTVATQPETGENTPDAAGVVSTPPRPWWRFWER